MGERVNGGAEEWENGMMRVYIVMACGLRTCASGDNLTRILYPGI